MHSNKPVPGVMEGVDPIAEELEELGANEK